MSEETIIKNVSSIHPHDNNKRKIISNQFSYLEKSSDVRRDLRMGRTIFRFALLFPWENTTRFLESCGITSRFKSGVSHVFKDSIICKNEIKIDKFFYKSNINWMAYNMTLTQAFQRQANDYPKLHFNPQSHRCVPWKLRKGFS